jgi:hypothetical protein
MTRIFSRYFEKRAAAVGKPSKRVAIMVPLPSPQLSEDDRISMRHLRKHLGGYDKFLLVPQGMRADLEGFSVVELDRGHFGSAKNHNRMLYRTDFWEHFADYEYVLMYHLDALVFSDQLQEWCDRGLDYIGSPFLQCADAPWVREERVGNGGFALYRVPSVLKVLWKRYADDPSRWYQDHYWRQIEFQRKLLRPVRAAVPGWLKGKATAPLRSQLQKMDRTEVNERGNDLFWSDHAKRYLPEFRVASLEDGLAFSFEMEPRRCLERTGGRMPFGCHAFGRYDRAFWEEHFLKEAS